VAQFVREYGSVYCVHYAQFNRNIHSRGQFNITQRGKDLLDEGVTNISKNILKK